MTNKNNNKQNIDISGLQIEFKNLKERFDDFISNDFEHLRQKVDWILWIFILGTLVSITINYTK